MRLVIRLTIVLLACAFSFEVCANGSIAEWTRQAGRLGLWRNLPHPSRTVFVEKGTPAHRLIIGIIRRPRIWYPPPPLGIAQMAGITSRHGSIAFYTNGTFGGREAFTYCDGDAAISRSDMAAIERCIEKGTMPHRAGGLAHGR